MAQFRTTADLVDAVLSKAGESTSGTSPYEADALTYLNKIHSGLIGGGLVFDKNVNEDWTWARARHPFTLELQPKQNTGSITLTQGSDAGTFSSAPTVSLEGWYLRETGYTTIYRIMQHTASSTAFELDAFYVGTSGSGKSFEAFKLDYEVVPSHLYIETGINDKLDFIRTGSTEATATLTAGAYTPTALAAHVATVVGTAAGGGSVYTCTYSTITRKFTLTSDTASSDVFKFLCATGTNVARSAWPTLGFDYTDDAATADTHISTYALGGVSRLISPARAYKHNLYAGMICALESRTFEESYALHATREATPRHFTILREGADGLITIHFNSYPAEKIKLELPVIPVPMDLKDNAASIPLVPRKYADVLEYGAAYMVCLDKEDDKSQSFMTLAQAQLALMQTEHRAQLKRTDPQFGEMTARHDQVAHRRLRFGYEVGQG